MKLFAEKLKLRRSEKEEKIKQTIIKEMKHETRKLKKRKRRNR